MRKLLLLAVLLVIVFVSVVAYRAAADRVSAMRLEVEETRKGVLEEVVTGTALVAHEETVIHAPEEGYFENLVRERERVRRGAILGKFFAENGTQSHEITAPAAGVVIYQTDGLESLLVPSKVEHLHPQVFSYNISFVRGLGGRLNKGEAFAKVVNNLKPNGLVVKLTDKKDTLTRGQEVEVRSGGKELGKAQVVAVQHVDDYILIGLMMDQFVIALADSRLLPVELVVKRYEGTIIACPALTEVDGKLGVYCLRKETVIFKEAEVVARKGGKAVVRGVEPGEYVITTPGLVREGMVIPR